MGDKRRKEIYELLYPETKNGGDRKSNEKIKFQILELEPDINKKEDNSNV